MCVHLIYINLWHENVYTRHSLQAYVGMCLRFLVRPSVVDLDKHVGRKTRDCILQLLVDFVDIFIVNISLQGARTLLLFCVWIQLLQEQIVRIIKEVKIHKIGGLRLSKSGASWDFFFFFLFTSCCFCVDMECTLFIPFACADGTYTRACLALYM